MLNNIVLVGRLTKEPELKELEDGKEVVNVTLAVSRNYKNSEGVFETDFIDCKLWGAVAKNTAEYCQKGDILGVKGRLESSVYEKDGEKHYNKTVVAEKITFLSNAKTKTKETEQEL